MKTILTIFCLVISNIILAQDVENKNVDVDMEDAIEEMDNGNHTLRFYNAVDGLAISDASINIEKIGKNTTDADGKIRFSNETGDGYYMVKFIKEGYITSDFKIQIMLGKLIYRKFSVSPSLGDNKLRIVLDWNKKPNDLDAHLEKKGKYHISYRNMSITSDGEAKLDKDDKNGYGPETITLAKIDENGDYVFFVHDYSNRNKQKSNKLSVSRARVKVYGDDGLFKTYYIPENKKGKKWYVFKIKDGNIIDLNYFE